MTTNPLALFPVAAKGKRMKFTKREKALLGEWHERSQDNEKGIFSIEIREPRARRLFFRLVNGGDLKYEWISCIRVCWFTNPNRIKENL